MFGAPVLARLGADLDALLQTLPAGAGVVQLLGPQDRPLLTARPASLRRWVGTQLGPARPVKPGRRPATDLRPLAKAVRYVACAGSFEQRLVHERWLAPLVPLALRRDLRPPAWLHLDLAERFPRLTVRAELAASGLSFGPWRDRAAAESASKALHKLFPLRPCDYVFEPQADLPLGVGCFYAQVKTCSAPCLTRIDEAGYRALARQAAALLAGGQARPAGAFDWLPTHCGEAGVPALVAERVGAALDLFPVRGGAVLDERARRVSPDGLEAALLELSWEPTGEPRDDRPWLAGWLHERKRRAGWVSCDPDAAPASLAAALLEELDRRP